MILESGEWSRLERKFGGQPNIGNIGSHGISTGFQDITDPIQSITGFYKLTRHEIIYVLKSKPEGTAINPFLRKPRATWKKD